jgi:hypothetical protein
MIIELKKCLVPACEGVDHRWEFERPTLREILRIQKVSGLDIDAWSDGLNEFGEGVSAQMIDSILALIDILHRRIGVRVPFEEIDVDLGAFDFILEDHELEQIQDEGQEDAGGEVDEGKDAPAQTEVSLPPEDEAASPGSDSGPLSGADSTPRSSPTPTASGGGSGSP